MALSRLNEAVLARVLTGHGNRGEFVDLSKKQIDELYEWVDKERKLRDALANYYIARENKSYAISPCIVKACKEWKNTEYMRSVETDDRQEEEDRHKHQAEAARLKRRAEAARLKCQAEENRLKCQAEENRLKRQAEEESILFHLRLWYMVNSPVSVSVSESEWYAQWYAQLFALPDSEDLYNLREIMSEEEEEEF